MCGVWGTWGVDGSEAGGNAALDRLAHRGPDGRGLLRDGDCLHGHVRLSLVDLSDASAQPFRLGRHALSWVGEAWNHDEVRAELRRLGVRFRTTGDTEVVAAAMARWGPAAALLRLEGMMAGCLSDGKGGAWLFRDRFGKVPLYVLRRGRAFTWASERRAFSAAAERGAAAALPPGCLLDLATGGLSEWWRLPDDRGGDASPEEMLDLLRAGVASRLRADAPTCVLVSGGLDSSLILRLAVDELGAGRVAAFTAVLDHRSADAVAARRLCSDLGVRLAEVPIGPPTAASLSEAVEAIEVRSKAQCEIAVACLPLAREVGRSGFKACLSGEAADELFGGYGNMCIRAASLCDRGWRRLRREQLRKMGRGNFVRCNKAFMRGSVECRLPFMERRLVERVLESSKGGCPPGKGLLKEAARLAGVPASVVDRSKETFQGGSGTSAALALQVANPTRFVAQECRRLFGRATAE